MTVNSQHAFNVSVLISGQGSNLQAIINAISDHQLPVNIVNVISNREDVPGLQRAQRAGIETVVISKHAYADRNQFDHALAKALSKTPADLFVLAGFMHILPDSIVTPYLGKMINIHPSLLPKYRGLHTHQQVLTNGDKYHGTTVHLVTPTLDAGPIIAQARFDVASDLTADSLKAQCQQLEHRLLPKVIGWFAEQRLCYQDDLLLFDQHPLPTCGIQLDQHDLFPCA